MEPPGLTMLDVLSRSGQMAMGVGKPTTSLPGGDLRKLFRLPQE